MLPNFKEETKNIAKITNFTQDSFERLTTKLITRCVAILKIQKQTIESLNIRTTASSNSYNITSLVASPKAESSRNDFSLEAMLI